MKSIDALDILWDELELYCSKHNDSVIHYWNLLEIIKEDLEKEILMKPIDNYKEEVDDEVFKNDSYVCPKCCHWVNIGQNYCDNCGQRLDWSECNE